MFFRLIFATSVIQLNHLGGRSSTSEPQPCYNYLCYFPQHFLFAAISRPHFIMKARTSWLQFNIPASDTKLQPHRAAVVFSEHGNTFPLVCIFSNHLPAWWALIVPFHLLLSTPILKCFLLHDSAWASSPLQFSSSSFLFFFFFSGLCRLRQM